MGLNDLNPGFADAATLLTSIVKQATGQNVITPTSLDEFVSIARSEDVV